MVFDACAVGDCIMDHMFYSKKLPSPGETVLADDFKIGPGGKSANACIAMARLGSSCAMISKVGNDQHGETFLAVFKDHNVDTSGVGVEKGTLTGCAMICVESGSGQNTVTVAQGANLLITPQFVREHTNTIKSSKYVAGSLEVPQDAILESFRIARQYGVKTMLNCAPAPDYLEHGFAQVTDVLCLNETEAALIVEQLEGRKMADSTTIEMAKTAARALRTHGYKEIVVTLGADGALLLEDNSDEPNLIGAPKVRAVDTTGAGDAFCGALVHFLAKYPEIPRREAVRRSCAVATLSVQKPGTQCSYPYAKDLSPDLLNFP